MERGYLKRHALFGKRVYFTAGQRSVRRFRLSRQAVKSIPKQRLPLEFAALAYCCCGEVIHKRLTPPELASEYAWLPKSLLHAHAFYKDYDQGYQRLGWIRVELSGAPAYIVEKHRRELYELQQLRQFRQLLEDDELLIVTITTSPERRDALIRELGTARWYPVTRVLDFPELAHFL